VVTVCYRTVAIAGLRRLLIPAFAERLDAVTLLSPSAVEAVIGAVGPDALRGLSVVCVGSTTAAALRRHGLTAVVATRGDAEGVAAAVAGALRW
jgi:uroporphyrinogen-III synthase